MGSTSQTMTRQVIFCCIPLCVVFLTVSSEKPNIVLLVADDMGWNDISWNNPVVYSPVLQSLATNGVIFNQSYVTSHCAPSRGSLLTGLYTTHTGLQLGILSPLQPDGLPLHLKLLPEYLGELGYKNHMIGKWHLGFCKEEYTPNHRGFHSFFGYYNGFEDYTQRIVEFGEYTGKDFRMNDKAIIPSPGVYSTFEFEKRAEEVIQSHDFVENPLFLYLAFQNVHTPTEVPIEYESYYSDIVDPARKTFLGMVSAMDEAVGKVIIALSEREVLDNTLIVFMSDNGGSTTRGDGNNYPLRGEKFTLYEGGTRVPTFVYGNMLQKTSYINNELIHAVDWVPTLVTLAGGTPDENIDGLDMWGTISQGLNSPRTEFIYNIDEESGDGSAIRVEDYKLIAYTDETGELYLPSEVTGSEHNVAVSLGSEVKPINGLQLYNLKDDPGETHNLAAEMPEKVLELLLKLEDYKATQVPIINSEEEPASSDPANFGGFWSAGWC